MRWFARKTRQDIWDEVIERPLGDIEAAERIRAICDAAAASADGSARNDKRDSERYERAAKVAMEIAMKISDGLMRDDAVHRIVDLCMKANDLKTAQILFRAIHASWIRETVQRDHPTLA
jgi:DNA-binding ferritin-like protein